MLWVWYWALGFDDLWIHCSLQAPIPSTLLKSPGKWGCLYDNVGSGLARKLMVLILWVKKIAIVLKNFDACPAEILNRNAKSTIGESEEVRIKTNNTSSSNPNCCFGPGFFRKRGFDGLNWYLFVVSISFPLKHWIFQCLGLRWLIIKSKVAAIGQPVYNLTIFGYFFPHFHDNLGQEITWCWC